MPGSGSSLPSLPSSLSSSPVSTNGVAEPSWKYTLSASSLVLSTVSLLGSSTTRLWSPSTRAASDSRICFCTTLSTAFGGRFRMNSASVWSSSSSENSDDDDDEHWLRVSWLRPLSDATAAPAAAPAEPP